MKFPYLMLTVSLMASPFAARADERPTANPANFPFQNRAIQFRLNQGFFKAGADLFEDILKSTGLVDKNNVMRIPDPENQVTHFLRYRKMRTSMQLYDGQVVGRMAIDISDSRFVVTSLSKDCVVSLKGPLQFDVALAQNREGGMDVAVPRERFDDSKLDVQTEGCGLFGGLVRGAVPEKFQDSIRDAIHKVANEDQLKMIGSADVDKTLRSANVFMNVPAKTALDPKRAQGQVDIDIGVQGFLSNARGGERVSIGNPRERYLNQMGFEWSLDAGLKARSKNVYAPSFQPRVPSASAPFPEWGLQPYRKSGRALDFDAGVMIRTSFLKSVFETLYAAGFFNIQVQDSLLNKKQISLEPAGWGEKFKVVLPSGERLTSENYKDSRLEIRLAAPPALNVKNDREFQLVIPDFLVTYTAKSKKDPKEFEVLKLRAKFNLSTSIGMDEDAKLEFRFNESPVQDFQVLSRNGVDPSVPDEVLEAEINRAVVGLLNTSSMEIPFLRGRKIAIQSLGIDGDGKTDKALALYLKVK